MANYRELLHAWDSFPISSNYQKAPDIKNFLSWGLTRGHYITVSGENSSSDGQTLLGITKQGNRFLRRLLTEAAKRFSVASTKKSKELLRRQKGNSEQIIAYADKANDRLRKRYYHLVMHNKKCANKATTAVARELACFIWGMMTDNTQTVLS